MIERQKVDHRRIEDAFFQYALLTIQAMYPENIKLSDLPMHYNTSTTLINITATYHEAFMKRYSGIKIVQFLCTEHRCSKSGCGSALVFDGNIKNHWSVCYVEKASYVQYEGLPGKLRTGCPNTPTYKSPYCHLHKPLISLPHGDFENKSNDEDSSPSGSTRSEPVSLIIGKRVTRNTTLYQAS